MIHPISIFAFDWNVGEGHSKLISIEIEQWDGFLQQIYHHPKEYKIFHINLFFAEYHKENKTCFKYVIEKVSIAFCFFANFTRYWKSN